MREILFRGKRKDYGKWIEGYYLHQNKRRFVNETHYIVSIDGFYYSIDPSTVCQFTGLYDKNGRKIFEGDIVNFYNGDGEFSPYEVRWQDSGFSVLMNGNTDLFDELDDYFSRHCEVIGNIYDNPELLKGGGGNV